MILITCYLCLSLTIHLSQIIITCVLEIPNCSDKNLSVPGCPDPNLTWSVLRRVQVAKDVAGGHGRHLIWGWGWTTVFYNRVSRWASTVRVRSRWRRRLRHLLIYEGKVTLLQQSFTMVMLDGGTRWLHYAENKKVLK